MVLPVTASPSCIQSYSPCSLISGLIQRVADCVASIFNAIAGLFSSCFGTQAPSPALTRASVPALQIPQPAYIPLQMIAHADELDDAAHTAAVEDGTRFLLDQIRVLQEIDRDHSEALITNLEVNSNNSLPFAQFFVHYLLSLPSFDQPNDVILDLRRQFAALSEEERATVLVSLKDESAYLPTFTEPAHDVWSRVRDLTLRYAANDVFSECADAAHRALITEGELIDPDLLVAKGTKFLIHEWKHTDARNHERLLGQFAKHPTDSLHKVIVYYLVFPLDITKMSNLGDEFLHYLTRTRAARALLGQVESMHTALGAFTEKERMNALKVWTSGVHPIPSVGAFHNALWELKGHFADIPILARCAIDVQDQLRSEGTL